MFLNQDESAVKRREIFQKGKEVIVVSAGGAGAVRRSAPSVKSGLSAA